MHSEPTKEEIIKPEDFCGTYSFYHDGWHGTLRLHSSADGGIGGTLYADRFEETFRVTTVLDENVPRKIEITIDNFNWTKRQTFTGYLFASGKKAMAGITVYEQQELGRSTIPFGFFARKTGALFLKSDCPNDEPVLPEDFAGRYSIYWDGNHGTLQLQYNQDLDLSGHYSDDRQNKNFPVIAKVDASLEHRVHISIEKIDRIRGMLLEGYLFTRPKNAVAGVVKISTLNCGFYMTKW